MSYVLDTEDVMCRKLKLRHGEAEPQKQSRVDRFSRWLEALAASNAQQPVTDEDAAALMALGSAEQQ